MATKRDYEVTAKSNLIYDFTKERPRIMILGGYTIMQSSCSLLIFNIFFLLLLLVTYIFLLVMSIISLIFLWEEKLIMVQVVHAICYVLVGIQLPLINLLSKNGLENASKIIAAGIFQYEDILEEYIQISKRRADQTKFVVNNFSKFNYVCGISTLMLAPFVQFLSPEETADRNFNPYLPFPIYMPFDTSNYLGYGTAFLAFCIFLFFLYSTIACMLQIYLGSTIQLISQLEVLNYSLRNIENRAVIKMARIVGVKEEGHSMDNLFENQLFQECFYTCLRENILHQQAISRFKSAVNPYIEGVNFMCMLSVSIVMAASIILITEDPAINLAFIMTLLSEVVGYFIMCSLCQTITDKSIETMDILYSIPWTLCNENIKVLLKIMMAKTQKPMLLRAAGFNSNICLETFGDMISIGYRIISVLRRS